MEEQVENDAQFFGLLKEFSKAKKAYDKLKDAMKQVAKDRGVSKREIYQYLIQ